MANVELDLKNLKCPLPILRAKKAIGDLKAGDLLVVQTTDPGSVIDFEAFCRQTGHQLKESTANGSVFTFSIKKT